MADPAPLTKGEIQKKEKREAQQQVCDSELAHQKLVDHMDRHYEAPQCPMLVKKYGSHEAVRSGFNTGLLPIKIADNVERERCAQGPQIVVTTQAQINQQNAKEKKAGKHGRSKSKDPRASTDESAVTAAKDGSQDTQ